MFHQIIECLCQILTDIVTTDELWTNSLVHIARFAVKRAHANELLRQWLCDVLTFGVRQLAVDVHQRLLRQRLQRHLIFRFLILFGVFFMGENFIKSQNGFTLNTNEKSGPSSMNSNRDVILFWSIPLEFFLFSSVAVVVSSTFDFDVPPKLSVKVLNCDKSLMLV